MSNGSVISPSTSKLIVGGFDIIGRAPGVYVSMTYNVANKVQTIAGVDGGSYMIVSGDYSVIITVNLLPNSFENSLLSGLFAAFTAAPNGLITPLLLTQGGTTYSGLGAVAGHPATFEMSDAAVTVPWVLVSGSMKGTRAGIDVAPVSLG